MLISPPFKLETVIATGASAGFGAQIVHAFTSSGAKVVAMARRIDRLEALAAEYRGNVLPVLLDVSDEAAITATIEQLPGAFGAVDCLVNNAGLALGLDPAQRASMDDWGRMAARRCWSSGTAKACRTIHAETKRELNLVANSPASWTDWHAK